jgi:hypothetical protein
MPIQVVHNAPAASIAGLGALAGDAKRMMDLYPLLVQQDQFAQQLGHQDQMAMFEAAQQAARQQQALQINAQQQLARDQQNFGQQEYLQRQNILGHLLGQQNQAFIQDQLQGARSQDWMARDQQAQEARLALDAQHQSKLLERRNAFEEEQARREQAQQWMDRFQDPFTEYEKNTAGLMKQGLEYTPDQSKALETVKKKIADLQDGVNSKRYSLNDVMPDFQALHSQLLRISPSQQKVTAEEQVRDQLVPIWGKIMGPDGKSVDDPNNFLGMGAPDPKTGVPKMVAPNRSTGKGQLGAEPQEGVLDKIQIEQQKAYESYQGHRSKEITALAKEIQANETALPFDAAYKRAEQLVPNTWDPRYTPKHLQGGQQPPPGGVPGAEGAPAPPPYDPVKDMVSGNFSGIANGAIDSLGSGKERSPEATAAADQYFQRMQSIAQAVPPEQQTPEFQQQFKRLSAARAARSLSLPTTDPRAPQAVLDYMAEVSSGKKPEDLDERTRRDVLMMMIAFNEYGVRSGLLKKPE